MPYAASAKIAPHQQPVEQQLHRQRAETKQPRTALFDGAGAAARGVGAREAQLVRCPGGGRHHPIRAVLDLAQHHRLGDVLAGGIEADVAVERAHVGGGERFAHRLGVERAGTLQSIRPHHHRGRGFGGLVGRHVTILLLEQRGVVGGAAEQVVAVAKGRRPLTGAQDALRGIPEPIGVGDLRRLAMRDGHDRGGGLQLRGLAHQQGGALGVAGHQQQVGAQRLHLEQGGGHVVQVARQLVVNHHPHAMAGGVVEHAVADVLGERVVLGGYRDLQRGRVPTVRLRPFGGQVDRLLQVLLGGGQHREQVAIALVEQRPRGAVALHHRHVVALGDRSDRLRQAGAVGTEHEAHPVLPDQPLGQLRAARRRRLVVVVQNLQAIAAIADAHAAALVDHLDREVVAPAGVVARRGVLAGKRHRRAEHDGVAVDPGIPGRGKQEQRRGQQQPIRGHQCGGGERRCCRCSKCVIRWSRGGGWSWDA